MTILWRQVAWHSVKGQNEKRPWRWSGTRPDGRSFKILHIPHEGFVASSFNGTRLGVGKSLSEAQNICEAAAKVKVAK